MITLIVLMSLFVAFASVFAGLASASISILTSIVPDLIIFYFMVRFIKSIIDKNKTKAKKMSKTSNVEEAKILKNMRTYFKNDARLYFDDETYITPSDPENINFETLNLYMRDEYISSLADYKTAFPNSYNTFIDMVGDYVKRSKFTKKETATPIVNEPQTKTNTKSETTYSSTKDAAYYIDKLNELNNTIEEEHITTDLQETVLYLSQIKKIEDTFPKCKTKTTKLYQYYLPMLVDILENYKRLSINATLHKEFKENEDRLLKTLVLINSALNTLTQSLCDEYYIEMSADMKTLETLLRKDGLTADEMTFENYKNKESGVTSNGN